MKQKEIYFRFIYFLILAFTGSSIAFAQTKISGTIHSVKGEALLGANIFIKGSYDGASGDANGNFQFTTTETGDQILVASFIGYKTKELQVKLEGKPLTFEIKLESDAKVYQQVTISAGAFEASDERKSISLKTLDILTTAGATGDLYGALNTLPGTSKVGETEGLFVRGGDASETRTIIDEMVVQKPYFSSVPDVPQRGRFSPYLFKGTIFSTGGYSAQYGQALSSALILRSLDLPPDTRSSFGFLAAGFNAVHTQRWEKSALAFSADYYNLAPYNSIIPQRVEWDLAPISKAGSLIYRYKTGESGMIKLYSTFSETDLSLFRDNLDDPSRKNKFKLKNQNIYINTNYTDILPGDIAFFAGYSYSNGDDDLEINTFPANRDDMLHQVKVKGTKGFSDNAFLTVGAEAWYLKADDSYASLKANLEDKYYAGFAETDFFISDWMAFRVGARYEYDDYIQRANFAPRTSFALKVGDNDQINFAYGQFYQTPDRIWLYQKKSLDYERADHFILNYQYVTNNRTFRIEGYYKDYRSLVKRNFNNPGVFVLPDYENNGSGYAKGIDIFWRDRGATFDNVDYWISYSYLDTKRDYRDFPTLATPNFASEHTLSVVYKQFFRSLNSFIGFTYTFSSGRPYYNPNNPVFNSDRTPVQHDLSFNASWLTTIFDYFTIVYLSVTNLPGYENIYSYRYSADGSRRQEVISPALRTYFFGVFISFDYK
ncbi:MAG: TonB-dependent receptor [Ignavibacteriales bacterium]|nr:TonB-dependent receptor [Ignavibacteria bacterium]MBZ0197275.1 TonB-dependent receptor [Ignavibacteriaceae bacterium]MCZ2144112.1 TonB-dependent receptor [Ignavibacteriales bacterium]WKZ72890.1 MAG: TonB-dependent receptor [Ignavibacteriaceae bacterium]